ncbi:MAG: protein kinase [Verrucomicrobia bacterium]|nr:protein kinase [Verrucomicrobiota bacterium]
MNPAQDQCPKCGTEFVGRQCPRCLLAAAMEPAALLHSEATPAPRELLGSMIGHYKLLEEIGEGGFGIVYLAQQTEPVKRRVALKIIKPGMDTREVVARFEAERQALALMDHPNIARVFDGGATASGRPYLVMELAKGVALTTYCDAARLNTRQRLELFLDVLAAVQHAHQKGIIHRDLKPSNILVAAPDGRPMIKVIDFGTAKAISMELSEKTMFTGFGRMIGTPQYMSPEQTERNALDVDTRSDLYSLGVVLYELLTGRTPLDPRKLREVGYEEIQRIIREDEPPRPSTRISTLGEALPEVARQHGTEPLKLGKQLRGDLDWIVMKALEKDRTRRYDTAAGMARDIEHHLQHEPVSAGPPRAAYRLRKLVRRHQGFFAALGAVLLCLTAGLAVSTFAFLRAHEALASEEFERQRAEQAQLTALAAKAEAETQLARAEAERTAARQSEERTAAAKQDADFQRDRAESQAQETEKQRMEAERQKAVAQHAQREAEAQRASSLAERRMAEEVIASLQYELQDRFAESDKLALLDGFADRVVTYYDNLSVEADSSHTHREKTVAMNFKANVLAAKGQTAEAIGVYRQVLELREGLAAESPADRQAQADVAQSTLKIASLLQPPSADANVLLERGLKIIADLETTGPLSPHQAGIKKDMMQLSVRLKRGRK